MKNNFFLATLCSFLFFNATHLSSSKDQINVDAVGSSLCHSTLEGFVGRIHKGQAFQINCPGHLPRTLGHASKTMAIGIKDQPGVFPAPLVNSDTLEFSFFSTNGNFTPFVVKPDGSSCKVNAKASTHSILKITIPYPAQTGIYSIVLLKDKNDAFTHPVNIEVRTGYHPNQVTHFTVPIHPSDHLLKNCAVLELIYDVCDSKISTFKKHPAGVLVHSSQ